MRLFYFHGFASSPSSRKAVAFQKAFEDVGISLEIPALDEADFEHLTLSKQLKLIETRIKGQPVSLIGSSMGGYLAALYASMHPEVDRLVLLAPAFAFARRWENITGPETMATWRDSGWLPVYHYGRKCESRVHYGLLEDARPYPDFPDFHQPALIFHGTNDDTVPVSLSREFAATHPNAVLHESRSDHELISVLNEITAASVPFLTAER